MSESNNASGGIGFGGLLQVALIVLKLCGVINWSWLLVFVPSIIGVCVLILVIAILLIVSE